MRVLIACEFSGVVRRAFRELGHDAWSCDLLPAEDGLEHIQGDIFKVLEGTPQWDLLVFHWPCTFLCNSGVRWLSKGGGEFYKDRWNSMVESAKQFRRLLEYDVPRIAGENPIPHKYALHFIGQKHTQVIQPWMFGHGETKATCLWLKNLPLLAPTDCVTGREPRTHYESPGPDRWKRRSRTLPGIARAMAEQWGGKL